MDKNRFFYRLYAVGKLGHSPRYLGTAFPIEPNGGLLTCRHELDSPLADGEEPAVFDNERQTFVPLHDVRYPSSSELDVAFLPNALNREKPEFLPLLDPQVLTVGESVYSFGFFAFGGKKVEPEEGYFAGRM